MVFSITDVVEFKKEIEEKLSLKIHFHDGCGGQYFTVDNPTQEQKESIKAIFAAKNLKAVFSENGEFFSVEEIR